MRTKKNHSNGSAEKTVKAIRRATRRQYAAEGYCQLNFCKLSRFCTLFDQPAVT